MSFSSQRPCPEGPRQAGQFAALSREPAAVRQARMAANRIMDSPVGPYELPAAGRGLCLEAKFISKRPAQDSSYRSGRILAEGPPVRASPGSADFPRRTAELVVDSPRNTTL